MSRKHLGIVVVVAVVLAAGAGALAARWPFRAAQPAPPPELEQPALTIDPHYLDFGEVWEQERFAITVPIRNTSPRAVEVVRFDTSCRCLSVDPPQGRIEVGQEMKFRVTLDVRSQCGADLTQPLRNFRIALTARIRAERGEAAKTWEIKGRVQRSILLPSPSVHLGWVDSGEVASGKFLIRVALGVKRLQVESRSPLLSVSVRRGLGDEYEVVASSADSTVGNHEALLALTAFTADGEKHPAIHLPIRWSVRPDIQVTPRVVVFPPTRVGESVEESVTIASRRGDSLTVVSWVATPVSGCQLNIVPDPVQDSTFRLQLRVTQPGETHGRISFVCRRIDGSSFETAVDVKGLGLALAAR